MKLVKELRINFQHKFRSVNRERGPVLHYKSAQTGGDQDGIPLVGLKIGSYRSTLRP